MSATRRQLLLAITFFDLLRVLMVLAVVVVFMLLADALFMIQGVPIAVGAVAAAVFALRQVDRMLERARRHLADARRITVWAAARAAERGGDDAVELLEGLELFDHWGGWLTAAGRELAWERAVTLLASTFDGAEDGPMHGQGSGFSRRCRRVTTSSWSPRLSSHSGRT
ncbi:MAG: hypothetical protein M3O70_20635 [Actinomycetota bacterium]|nr:hypothetical protein [Actinomycetota bacterium]